MIGYMTWEETELAFPIFNDRAVKQETCFCKCGCRAEGVKPLSRFEKIVPGVCVTCNKSRNWRMHERAYSAAYIYREPEDDATPIVPERRRVTPEEREAALRYVRTYLAGGTQMVDVLQKRLAHGKDLTDSQVEAALRSEAADERHARRVVRHAESKRAEPVSIPPTIRPGYYAVECDGWVMMKLDRPNRGPMHGGVVVSASADMTMAEVGVQDPSTRLRRLVHMPPLYRGRMMSAVAALVSNPTQAQADYQMLIGGTDDRRDAQDGARDDGAGLGDSRVRKARPARHHPRRKALAAR